MSDDTGLNSRVAAVRRFNRFYTRQIGVLREGLLHSPFSLTEVRVLFELNYRDGLTASDLGRDLAVDAGYLSRILKAFEARGLLARRPSPADGRRSILALTEAGREVFAPLDAGAAAEVAAMLEGLPPAAQADLIAAMGRIEALLAPARPLPPPPVGPSRLRPPEPGELGWVVQRHGALYAQEYGWDQRFEGLVAGVVAEFAAGHDPARERCWIAEVAGRPAGSILLAAQSAEIARLRLLLVEPSARGMGLGARLVDECLSFARLGGYAKVVLWTNDVLHAARRIYQQAGFRLVHREEHRRFGPALVGETWELAL